VTDTFTRADGYRIEQATYHHEPLPAVWWVFHPDGHRVKSYMADRLEDADERFSQDLERGRIRD